MDILVLQGPNLNLLGVREPGVYGIQSLADIHRDLQKKAKALGRSIDFLQSNSESALIDRVHAIALQPKEAKLFARFVIINPAAFTHTSVALRDALLAVAVPFVEVHLSNVYSREPFRHHSYLSDKAVGVISGLGAFGYQAALEFAHDYLNAKTTEISKGGHK